MQAKLYTSLFAFLTLSFAAYAQNTKIIPPTNNDDMPGNSTMERKPYGNYYGYERMAAIYTASEIGSSGDVKLIGFYMNNVTSGAAATPAKVYLKHTTSNTISSSDFASEVSGATLVYDATISSFSANTWIDITIPAGTFLFDGTSNLEVLVEANGGGSGTESSTDKAFRYHSTGSDMFQHWQADGSPPSGTGTIETYRPNLKIEAGCEVAVNLGEDTTICTGGTLRLDAGHPGSEYRWNTGATTQTIGVTQGGWYKVNIVTANDCKGKDSVYVDIYPVAELTGVAYTNTANHYMFSGTGIYNITDYQWDFGDGNTSTDPNPSHWYANAGAYTVKVIASNRCGSKQASITVNAPVGLQTLQYDQGLLNIYPNPAVNDLYLENKTGTTFKDISFYSSMGQQVLQNTPDQGNDKLHLDISGLAQGMYLMRIVTDKGMISHPVMIRK